MNLSTRFASSFVVLLGALVTMGTSRAPGPRMTLEANHARELAAGETVHLTTQISEPAMDFMRANGGSVSLQAQTSAGAFTLVPDDAASAPTAVPAAMEGGVGFSSRLLECSATGPCVVGLSLTGPAGGTAAQITIRVTVAAATDAAFPADSVISFAED